MGVNGNAVDRQGLILRETKPRALGRCFNNDNYLASRRLHFYPPTPWGSPGVWEPCFFLHPLLFRLQILGCIRDRINHGLSPEPGPWPWAQASSPGPRPGPWARALGPGPGAWALGPSPGPGPWPRALALALGPGSGPGPWARILGPGGLSLIVFLILLTP